jgi:hydrogenase expression/formation protein HypC
VKNFVASGVGLKRSAYHAQRRNSVLCDWRKNMCLAVPGKIVDIYGKDGTIMGKIDFDGIMKEICLAYVPDINVGDYALVHVGFAMQKLDEKSALQTLKMFRELGALEAEFCIEEGKGAATD